MKKSALVALAPVAAAVAIAGCGGSSNSSGGSGGYGGGGSYSKSAGSPGGVAGPTVQLATSKFGKILVDGHGRTLYDFAADTSTTSTCYGACASLWPPLTVSGAPKASQQLPASLLGTTRRTDGKTEVTYGGHPLYYFAGDTKQGDTTGQAISQFGAPWYVLTRRGSEVTHG